MALAASGLSRCYEDARERRRVARESILSRPCLLWVLDGLDEVVQETVGTEARDWVVRVLRDRPDDYLLVTSRDVLHRCNAHFPDVSASTSMEVFEVRRAALFSVRRCIRP